MSRPDITETLPDEGGTVDVATGEWPERDAASRYIDQRVLGRGGMGEVWQAWDTQLRRHVAIKRARVDGSSSLGARLIREARITAALAHPGIVSVYDAGIDTEGRPWYAMQVVRGRTLADHLTDDLTRSDRRRLVRHVLAVCEAAGFAHHAGVVHRDLKPHNVQIGAFGETQILDWGLARPADGMEHWETVLSGLRHIPHEGVALGTPAYMSPEQAKGVLTGPPSDVWSLGVVLYEVIAGAAAYLGTTREQVRQQVLSGPPTPLSERAPDVDSELSAIVSRALQPAPEARYPDATALARDLSAYLDGRRVSAHRYTTADEIRRTLRRWRVPLLAVSAGLIGLAAAGAVGGLSVWQEKQRLQRVQGELESALDDVDLRLSEALTQRALLAFKAGDLGHAQLLAVSALKYGEDPDARGILADASPHPRRVRRIPLTECHQTGFTLDGVVCVDKAGVRLIDEQGHTRNVSTLASLGVFTQPWSSIIAVRQPNETLQRIDTRTGESIGSAFGKHAILERHGPSLVPGQFVSTSSASMRIAGVETEPESWVGGSPCDSARHIQVALLGPDDVLVWCSGGQIVHGPPSEPQALLRVHGDHTPDSIAVDQTGRFVAFGEVTGDVWVLDLHTGTEVLRTSLGPARAQSVALSADGHWLAAQVPDTGVQIIEVTTGQRHQIPSHAQQLSFDEEGHLRVKSLDAFELWALPNTAAFAPVSLQSTGVVALSWKRDLIVAGGNRTGRIHPDAAEERLQHGPSLPQTKSAAALPSGHMLIGTLRGVFIDEGDAVRVRPGDDTARRVLPMADDYMLMLGGPTHLWHPATDQSFQAPGGVLGTEGAVSSNGHVAVFLTQQEELFRVDLAEPPSWTSLGTHSIKAVAAGPDGWPIFLGTQTGLDLLSADGVRTPWAAMGKQVTDIAVSPDGQRVAATDTAHRTWVWRVKDGSLLARLQGHTRRVSAVAFSPGGTHLATGSWDDTVRFWDVSRMEQPVPDLRRTIERGWGVSASP